MIRHAFPLAAALALAACASDVLPSTDRATAGPFPTYEIAEIAYKVIEPGRTDSAKLRELGIDPRTTPNLRVINYVEVMRVFMPTDTVALADLDPAVQGCIGAKTACTGYVLAPEASATQRTGHVSLDVLGFQRETQETGWAASMLLLLVDDIVVYKLWSGTPNRDSTARETNPLGPAQDLSGTAKDAIGGAIPKP
jgi:hypothetical protein